MSLTQPQVNAVPFARDSTLKNNIPVTTTEKGAASFSMGFPYETMIKKIAGGVYPDGEDFNGIFHYLSLHQVWLNAGGQYKFNPDLASAVGGYSKGAIVLSDDASVLFISTKDNNADNPNTVTTNWRYLATYDEIILLAQQIENDFLRKSGGTITGDLTVSGLLNAIASSAKKLETARRINDILFDGTQDIQIPTVRAFALYDGINQQMLKSSGISAVQRVSGGFFLVTLAKAAPDNNYIVNTTPSWGGTAGASATLDDGFVQTTTQFQIRCTFGGDNTLGSFNPARLNISVSY